MPATPSTTLNRPAPPKPDRKPAQRPSQEPSRRPERRRRMPKQDAMAVWSFVMGLVGLLIFNVVLGPVALTLAALALKHGTARRGRALLGLTLGAADLIIFASLAAADGTISWSLGA
ncbi:hypothetical protein ACFQ2B_12580 [Streptomyces stramineus]|uniref:DUF4190 domain-containing protein n=1 Tax=Streptomyces stramineus TaxID=173861 RepID=A0ABN1AAU4_9ACTN